MTRNKTVDEFLISDWIDAYTSMNRSAFNKLKKVALNAGIEIPSFVQGNSKPVVHFQFSKDSLTDQYSRVHNTERVNLFKKDIEEWATKVEEHLRSSILDKKQKSREYEGKKLADSLSHKIHLDTTYYVEPRSIGFKFDRHGIYWAKGAYKGHGGYIGSKWTDRYGRLKKTADKSIGMIGVGERKAVDWFNPVVDEFIKELEEIAVNYCGDMTLDLTKIYIR